MKAFRKWFEENYPLPATTERGPVGRDFKNGCSGAWRAALEWIYYEGVIANDLAGDLIEEELENGDS